MNIFEDNALRKWKDESETSGKTDARYKNFIKPAINQSKNRTNMFKRKFRQMPTFLEPCLNLFILMETEEKCSNKVYARWFAVFLVIVGYVYWQW